MKTDHGPLPVFCVSSSVYQSACLLRTTRQHGSGGRRFPVEINSGMETGTAQQPEIICGIFQPAAGTAGSASPVI